MVSMEKILIEVENYYLMLDFYAKFCTKDWWKDEWKLDNLNYVFYLYA